MKKLLFKSLMVMGAMLATVGGLTSCHDESGNSNNSGKESINPLNTAYAGTKWTVSNVDYSFGENWAGEQHSTITVFFYSNTEGAFYFGNKDYYTDMGTSSSRELYFFNYDVSNEGIELYYFTLPADCNYLSINNGILFMDKTELTKKSITSDDTKWLNEHMGTTGQCKWYHDLMGDLYIVGEGDMDDYASGKCPWSGLGINSVVVKDGVTSIGNNAFYGLSVANLDLPNSITRIGANACAGLYISSFDVPVNVVEIGDGAFAGCEYLKSLKLSNSKLERIGEYAFSNCAIKMTQFSLPSNVKSVGTWAFMGAKLGKITLNEKLETIGSYAFTGVSGTLTIPNSVKEISPLAFEGSFNNAVIGTGLTSLASDAFCTDAKSGTMYVNLGVPLEVDDGIINDGSGFGDAESKWTLYVPKGSKTAYQKKSPWSKFKSIIEDTSLTSGNGTPDGNDNEDSGNDNSDNEETKVYDKETYEYEIDGVTYKMILVDNGTMPAFRIMQTELPPNKYLKIGTNYFGPLSSNDDIVIKTEFVNFINHLREVTGTPFRLPTKEEWQLAARGGKKDQAYTYSGSNNIDDVAWYKDNSSNMLHKLATKNPNELGIYDMCGNYGEMCNGGDGLNGIDYNIDGIICGGSYKDNAYDCQITSYKQDATSGKIAGTKYKCKNAFDGRYITIRLVYTVPK